MPKNIDTVLTTLQSPYLIIKSIIGSCSTGVCMIETSELEQLCKHINAPTATDHAFAPHEARWLPQVLKNIAHSDRFIISAYAPSQTLIIRDKPYDPTMRVMFLLNTNNQIIECTFLGGFWKIPYYSLDDPVALTEKNITRAHLMLDDPDELYSGIPLDDRTKLSVQNILADCLPHLYYTMLTGQAL